MYLRVRKRMNKYSDHSFYFYLCESKRTEGKVTNTQKYLLSIKQQELLSGYFNTKVNAEELGIDKHVKEMIENKICALTEK